MKSLSARNQPYGNIKSQLYRIMRLMFPMAGTRMIGMAQGFIGMMLVSHLGKEVLAACALIGTIQSTVFVLGMSLLFSIGIKISQFVGAEQPEKVGAVFQAGVVLTLLISIPLMAVFYFIMPILSHMHEPVELLSYVHQYFHIFTWLVFPFILQVSLQQVFFGCEKSSIVLRINLIVLCVFIPVSYSLIHGLVPSLPHGIAGLAFTYVITLFLRVALLLGYASNHAGFKKYQLFKRHKRMGTQYLGVLFKIGIPMLIQFGGELFGIACAMIFIGWIGTNALAAVQIAQQYVVVVIVPIFAMSESLGIIIAQEVGAKRYHNLQLIVKLSKSIVMAILAVVALIYVLFSMRLESYFINIHLAGNANVVELAHVLMLLSLFSFSFDAMRNLMSGALRGLQDTAYAMKVGVGVIWLISIPLGYLLAFNLSVGVIGFTLSRIAAYLVGFILLQRYWSRRTANLVGLS